MRITIPVMHSLDNNYAIAAAVAFYSMLENSSSDYDYQLYVLHSDISIENQRKLEDTVSKFENSILTFIDMRHVLSELFASTANKAHFSKEMYYKFLAPSILAEHEKTMIADVDVLYLNDISENFVKFDVHEDYYIAGQKLFCLRGSWVEQAINFYYKDRFCDEELRKLAAGVAGGYYIFNLSLMRADDCEAKFLEYAKANSHRLVQPEQDAISLICYPKIKYLPSNSLVCTYFYGLYKTDHDFANDLNHNADEIKYALSNPVQLHYTGQRKPWHSREIFKSDIWFQYLAKTAFANDVPV